MATFGENLKRIRKRRKITQTQLAEMVGQTQACISKWENGERMPRAGASRNAIARYENDEMFPKYANLKAIADVLGCTIGELLGEELQEPKQDVIEIIVKINGDEVMRWRNTDTEGENKCQ